MTEYNYNKSSFKCHIDQQCSIFALFKYHSGFSGIQTRIFVFENELADQKITNRTQKFLLFLTETLWRVFVVLVAQLVLMAFVFAHLSERYFVHTFGVSGRRIVEEELQLNCPKSFVAFGFVGYEHITLDLSDENKFSVCLICEDLQTLQPGPQIL